MAWSLFWDKKNKNSRQSLTHTTETILLFQAKQMSDGRSCSQDHLGNGRSKNNDPDTDNDTQALATSGIIRAERKRTRNVYTHIYTHTHTDVSTHVRTHMHARTSSSLHTLSNNHFMNTKFSCHSMTYG